MCNMDRKGKQKDRGRLADGIVFAAVLTAVSALTLMLFYRQTLGGVDSDMKAYILEMQGLESGYSFPYPVFFKLAALIHLFAPPEWSVAITVTLLNGLAMAVTKLALDHMVLPGLERGFRKRFGRNGTGVCCWLPRVLVSFLAFSLFFISMLYPPPGIYLPGIRFRYVGVFTANPFHNATFMAARPFAILAFLWYVKLLPVYEKGPGQWQGKVSLRNPDGPAGDGTDKKANPADYVLFSLFLFLATMTKPSFTLVLVSTAGLLMLYRLIRCGFRNFLPAVQLGLCFVPTFGALLYQYKGVFVPGEGQEGGIGFCLGDVWADYCDNIPLGIGLAIGFPLLVLVFNRKQCGKNTLFRFSWQMYLVSLAEAFFLYEKGFRKVDFNFSWGYMYGIFFCHLGALVVLLGQTGKLLEGKSCALGETPACKEKADGKRRLPGKTKFPGPDAVPGNGKASTRGADSIWISLQWLAYLAHLLCGLLYFKDLLLGGTYY